ncbi:MAG: thiamine-phosphate kinase [Actinomycetota bacterium]|nr:thiamine-phosphate kinase [Actinomycetota bacterium]
MSAEARTVSELGESGLIELVAAHLPPAPPNELWTGDDAALIVLRDPAAIVTTDTMVEGHDFDLSYCSGFDVGWKAVAVNVSDVAAMAGRPTHAVATLALPPSTLVALADGIGAGLAAAARRWEVAVVGGDVSAAPVLVVAVTLLGAPAAERVVTRTGARPGDVVCVTGSIGGAWGGLQLLRSGRADASPALVERHLRPVARVDEGHALLDAGATAMIDVSDGFAIDLTRLMAASETGCVVDPAAVPLHPELRVLGLRDDDLVRGAILGGEDFELIATLPRDAVTPAGVTVVGEVTEGQSLRFGDEDLAELGREHGWDHLRGR